MRISILLLSVVSILFFISCGDDEGVTTSLQDRIKGTWVQSRFVSECDDNTLDEEITFECDDVNCQKLILGDSTFVTVNTINGNENTIDEFYLFVVGVNNVIGNEIEVCDGVDFNRQCNRVFSISQNGNRLLLTRESVDDEEVCTDTFEYVRFVEDES